MISLKKIYESIHDRSRLITALKNSDKEAAKKAVSGMSPQSFSLTNQQFNELLKYINFDQFDKARKMLNVEKEYIPSTNPFKLNKYEIEQLINFIDKFSGASLNNEQKLNDLADELEEDYFLKGKELDLKQMKNYDPNGFNILFDLLDTYHDNKTQDLKDKEKIEKIYDKIFDASGT